MLTAVHGGDHVDVGKALNGLGNVLHAQRRLEDAKAQYSCAIAVYVRTGRLPAKHSAQFAQCTACCLYCGMHATLHPLSFPTSSHVSSLSRSALGTAPYVPLPWSTWVASRRFRGIWQGPRRCTLHGSNPNPLTCPMLCLPLLPFFPASIGFSYT